MSLLQQSESAEPVLLKGREELKQDYRPVSRTCTNQAGYMTRAAKGACIPDRQRRKEERRVVCGKSGGSKSEEIHQSKTGEREGRAKAVERKVGQITKHREDSRAVLGPLDTAVIFFRRKIFRQSPTETQNLHYLVNSLHYPLTQLCCVKTDNLLPGG